MTPKALSITRWESHIKSVRAIISQTSQLRDALIEIANSSTDDMVRSEATSLCTTALEDFEFLISLCIWYKILDKVNWVSKILQQEEMDIEDAVIKTNELLLFFEQLREYGFDDLMMEAKELADKVGIDPIFPQKRVVRRTKKFDEDVGDDSMKDQSLEDNFRVTYFLQIIDQALTSLKDRFEQFEHYEATFGLLFNAKFRSMNDEELLECCIKLESFLEYKQVKDIDSDVLFQELVDLKKILPMKVKKAIDILHFLRSY